MASRLIVLSLLMMVLMEHSRACPSTYGFSGTRTVGRNYAWLTSSLNNRRNLDSRVRAKMGSITSKRSVSVQAFCRNCAFKTSPTKCMPFVQMKLKS
ncbi:hypothetical protein VNO77_02444 [Canavalia gladiata]|uniref:Secreted protein n=1 Tax=Canavalia gladiata TaxID=3824 RepID=A0AAN9MT29_CANGL